MIVGQVLLRDELRHLRRGRGEEEVDLRVVLHEDAPEQVGVDRRRAHHVDDALAVEAEVQEDPVVAELEVRVHEADAPAELALEGDGHVDRDRGRPHAALGAVEGEHAAEGRPSDAGDPWGRSGPAGS